MTRIGATLAAVVMAVGIVASGFSSVSKAPDGSAPPGVTTGKTMGLTVGLAMLY